MVQTAVVQVSQLFIVSPTPMILLSEVMTMFLGSQVRHPAHSNEQSKVCPRVYTPESPLIIRVLVYIGFASGYRHPPQFSSTLLFSLVLGRFVQIDDMYGTWNANAYIDERDEIIHALAKWADKDPRR